MLNKILIPPVFVLLCLGLIVYFHFSTPEYNIIPFPFNLAGIVISFSGFVIMGKSRELFKKHNTALEITAPSYLISEGVYAKSRNPMYVGMFILIFGIAIVFQNVFSMLSTLGFIVLVELLVIPREEKFMLHVFGDEYLNYKKNTRRWI